MSNNVISKEQFSATVQQHGSRGRGQLFALQHLSKLKKLSPVERNELQ